MTTIKVLDKGFVKLLGHFGNDIDIVKAARVSYSGKGTKTVSDDRQLIRYLVRHQHMTPIEMVVFRFHIKLPIFCARQLIRYRTGISVNEVSARYSILNNEAFIPNTLRKPCKSNKQGSIGRLDSQTESLILSSMYDDQQNIFESYDNYIKAGVCKEQARINLPVSTYTEWIYTVNLRSLFHIMEQRLDSHAQEEIQVYAQAIKDLITPIVPMAIEAFEDYILNAKCFSKLDMDILLQCIDQEKLKDLIKQHPTYNDLEQRELLNKIK